MMTLTESLNLIDSGEKCKFFKLQLQESVYLRERLSHWYMGYINGMNYVLVRRGLHYVTTDKHMLDSLSDTAYINMHIFTVSLDNLTCSLHNSSIHWFPIGDTQKSQTIRLKKINSQPQLKDATVQAHQQLLKHMSKLASVTNYWCEYKTLMRSEIIPEICWKKNGNPAQALACASAQPGKKSFCSPIGDLTLQTPHTHTHTPDWSVAPTHW